MKKQIRILLCGLLFAGILGSSCIADEPPTGQVATEYMSEGMYEDFSDPDATQTSASVTSVTVGAKAAVLMERASGKVLFEKNPDEQRSPASITKIMTLLLVMEGIENGKIALTDRVVASAHACSMGGSQIWLEEGETMTVDHLIKAVCVASANDAAVALGEHVAGSDEGFVAQMNARAKELGMKNTHFVNCCGLDAENHYTSARDVAIMSRELIAHPLITQYSTIWMDTLREGQTQLVNTNKLVRFYEGATGLKTGTTDEAGYCVSATAQKNGMDLIAVVLGGETGDKRFADSKQLLNFGFANWSVVSVDQQAPTLPPLSVNGGVKQQVELTLPPAGPFLVEKGTSQTLTHQITLPDHLSAPITAGQIVGKIAYYDKDTLVGEGQILAKESISAMTFGRALWMVLEQLIKI